MPIGSGLKRSSESGDCILTAGSGNKVGFETGNMRTTMDPFLMDRITAERVDHRSPMDYGCDVRHTLW